MNVTWNKFPSVLKNTNAYRSAANASFSQKMSPSPSSDVLLVSQSFVSLLETPSKYKSHEKITLM